MDHNAVEFLKERIDAEQLLRHYDAKRIHKMYNQIRCCCPIHKGDNPDAFVFRTDRKLWYCHTGACGGGDIFDLTMAMEKLDFVSAVRRIAEIFGVDISNMTIAVRTNKVLQDTKNWVDFMRKMLDNKIITQFDITTLGDLYPINSYRHFTRETLDAFNIKYCNNNKRIVIPIYQNDILAGVTMRRTTQHPAKWLHQPSGINTGDFLFNIDNIPASTITAIVVGEGPWEVLNLYQNGYCNAVATFGCHLTPAQEQLLLRKTYTIVMAYDNDSAGIKGTQDVIKRLSNKVNIRIANIPPGKDVGELDEAGIQLALGQTLSIQEWRSMYGFKS